MSTATISSIVETTAIIGKRKTQDVTPEDEEPEIAKLMAGSYHWPVSVSYFSSKASDQGGEKLPVYQVSYYMHEDGVSRRLRMQYPDYSLKGDLKKLEYLEFDKCE